MTEHFDPARLAELCEKTLEDRLTDEERTELERLVLDHSEARRFYVDYVAQHVALQEFFAPYRATASKTGEEILCLSRGRFSPLNARLLSALSLLLAVSLVVLALWAANVFRRTPPDDSVPGPEIVQTPLDEGETAPKTEEKNGFGRISFMASGSLSEGSDGLLENNRVGPGELRLLSGAAQIHLDHGVVLTVESPIHLKFYSMDRCFLHSGRLFAKVGPDAIGFTVETPVAEIRDLGTEFGVSVGDDDKSDVQVFSGRVDVVRKDETEIFPITTGGWLRFIASEAGPQNPHDRYFGADSPGNRMENVCTTAGGRSQEACIVSGGNVDDMNPHLKSQSKIYTLLKNSRSDQWHRKGYFSIDLSSLPDTTFQDVQLELAFAPTGVGLLAVAPEISRFTVYGLRDETGDFWREEDLVWSDAPANLPGAAEVDPEKTVLIGSFEIPREQEAAKIVLSGEELKRFLSTDGNHIVTFIVVRDTAEESDSGYAHGFANRHHPILPPPTLRFFR